MRVLVTGGSGMLGKALVRRLAGRHTVIPVSKSGRESTERCDLSDAAAVKALFNDPPFDLAIHTAAYSDVDGCERDPALAHSSNGLATRHLAEACGAKKVPLVYVSTDYVFDGMKDSPYLETDPAHPVNIYGMTKLEGEKYAASHCRVSVIVRTSWLFGTGNPSNFVNAVLARLRKEPSVSVLDDQEDSPTYVADLAEALEKIGSAAVEAAKKGGSLHEIYHVCNTGHTTRLGMTLKMKEVLGLKTEVKRMDAAGLAGRLAIRPRFAVMSTARYQKAFGKLRPWEDALKDYLEKQTCAS